MATFHEKKSQHGARKNLETLFEMKRYNFGKKSFTVMVPRRAFADMILKKSPKIVA